MSALTLVQAMKILEMALSKGRETKCEPLTVSVLDSGGHLKAFAREDATGILRPGIALGKAWGSLGMGMGSRALAERAAKGPQSQIFFNALSTISVGRMVPAPGGVLIRDPDGEIIGAVGISGDKPEKDEACAIAGIEAAGLTADPG
jgi:uncharacterized protein GlcG (DUF336 family)